MAATKLAMNDEKKITTGVSVSIITILVSAVKRLLAGMKPPYMIDWKADVAVPMSGKDRSKPVLDWEAPSVIMPAGSNLRDIIIDRRW